MDIFQIHYTVEYGRVVSSPSRFCPYQDSFLGPKEGVRNDPLGGFGAEIVHVVAGNVRRGTLRFHYSPVGSPALAWLDKANNPIAYQARPAVIA